MTGRKQHALLQAVDRNTPDLPSIGEIQNKVKQEGNAAGGAPSLDTKGTKDQVSRHMHVGMSEGGRCI